MSWSAFGKALVRALPHVIEVVEGMAVPGADKKALAFKVLHDEVHDLEPMLASHPKVLEAVGKANDALVEVQNVVLHVKGELEAQSK